MKINSRLRRKLRNQEKNATKLKVFRLKWLIATIMEEEFGKKIYKLKKADLYRLFVLDTWRQRYRLSIRQILQILVPYYEKKFAKYSKKKTLFGTRLATLTGKHSEKFLELVLTEMYPDNEQVAEWRNRRQLELLEQREFAADWDGWEQELHERRKSLLDFKTPKQYARYYEKIVLRGRRKYKKEVTKAENKNRPYRGSPWV